MAKQRKHYMKNKGGTYKNGQLISEQKGKTLTYYFQTGEIKAKGKSIDGVMEGKWICIRLAGDATASGGGEPRGPSDAVPAATW